MAAIKETQIRLDEHGDTAVESVNDSTATKSADKGHEMANVSQTSGAFYQHFEQYPIGDNLSALADNYDTTNKIANVSHVSQEPFAALQTEEEKAHEAEKQKAREKSQETSKNQSILFKRMSDWRSCTGFLTT